MYAQESLALNDLSECVLYHILSFNHNPEVISFSLCCTDFLRYIKGVPVLDISDPSTVEDISVYITLNRLLHGQSLNNKFFHGLKEVRLKTFSLVIFNVLKGNFKDLETLQFGDFEGSWVLFFRFWMSDACKWFTSLKRLSLPALPPSRRLSNDLTELAFDIRQNMPQLEELGLGRLEDEAGLFIFTYLLGIADSQYAKDLLLYEKTLASHYDLIKLELQSSDRRKNTSHLYDRRKNTSHLYGQPPPRPCQFLRRISFCGVPFNEGGMLAFCKAMSLGTAPHLIALDFSTHEVFRRRRALPPEQEEERVLMTNFLSPAAFEVLQVAWQVQGIVAAAEDEEEEGEEDSQWLLRLEELDLSGQRLLNVEGLWPAWLSSSYQIDPIWDMREVYACHMVLAEHSPFRRFLETSSTYRPQSLKILRLAYTGGFLNGLYEFALLPSLEELDIRGYDIDSEQFRILTAGLAQYSPGLQRLLIEGRHRPGSSASSSSWLLTPNNIASCWGSSFREMMIHGRLTVLSLRSQNLNDEVAMLLAGVFVSNQPTLLHLQDLDLANNKISDHGALLLLHALKNSTSCSLKRLNLAYNKLKGYGLSLDQDFYNYLNLEEVQCFLSSFISDFTWNDENRSMMSSNTEKRGLEVLVLKGNPISRISQKPPAALLLHQEKSSSSSLFSFGYYWKTLSSNIFGLQETEPSRESSLMSKKEAATAATATTFSTTTTTTVWSYGFSSQLKILDLRGSHRRREDRAEEVYFNRKKKKKRRRMKKNNNLEDHYEECQSNSRTSSSSFPFSRTAALLFYGRKPSPEGGIIAKTLLDGKVFQNLEILRLGESAFNDEDLRDFCLEISDVVFPRLWWLDLSDCEVGEGGVLALVEKYENFPQLHRLTLTGTQGIGPKALQVLTNQLSAPHFWRYLQELSLSLLQRLHEREEEEERECSESSDEYEFLEIREARQLLSAVRPFLKVKFELGWGIEEEEDKEREVRPSILVGILDNLSSLLMSNRSTEMHENSQENCCDYHEMVSAMSHADRKPVYTSFSPIKVFLTPRSYASVVEDIIEEDESENYDVFTSLSSEAKIFS